MEQMARNPSPSRTGARNAGLNGLRRLIHYRIVIPLKRSRHGPEHTARGTLVGLVWAFTPTVGIQMVLVLATWVVTRRLFGWDFNVFVAMAWTWVTNVVTLVPVYYVLFLTGQLMMGHWDDLAGYGKFVELWQGSFQAGGMLDWMAVYFTAVVRDWGLPMLVGSVPWALATGGIGYVWSLRFVIRHRAARERRRRARATARGGETG